ncbi:MAG TPA: hypothetical protein VKF15_06325 [Nitrososphaerales archaeon]|nr:hypothetical protein [Nitrososphaerales archaeon]
MSKNEKNEEGHISVDNVKDQLMSFEHQIKQYLERLEATVDTYKFSVEKQGEGLTIDMALRATIHVGKLHAGKSTHK